jgi:predicted NAD/FAD-binding protein
MKIAIIGTGIAGNAASWLLNQSHDITVYEQNDYIGGHANTIDGGAAHKPVDTGFIVYNEWTYPNLIALFAHLGVKTEKTNMSLAVSVDNGRLEYSGNSIFGQKKNILNPRFYLMLLDLVRFYKSAPKFLENQEDDMSLGDYLKKKRYSKTFIEDHLLPMAAAIWSTSADDIRHFPARSFIRFFVNHGLFLLKNRPQWWTVTGGSRQYVDILTASFKDKIKVNAEVTSVERKDDGVNVTDSNGDVQTYDHVVMASHADESYRMLTNKTTEEKAVLAAFPYGENVAYLHSDETYMPKGRRMWSSWNYLATNDDNRVSVTYWMNRLQPFLPSEKQLFVTLNPLSPPDPQKTIKVQTYQHPQYLMSAIEGWPKIKTIQGKDRVWFCGAWCGYGFHEDGVSSGLAVAEALGGLKRPWDIQEKSPAGLNAKP